MVAQFSNSLPIANVSPGRFGEGLSIIKPGYDVTVVFHQFLALELLAKGTPAGIVWAATKPQPGIATRFDEAAVLEPQITRDPESALHDGPIFDHQMPHALTEFPMSLADLAENYQVGLPRLRQQDIAVEKAHLRRRGVCRVGSPGGILERLPFLIEPVGRIGGISALPRMRPDDHRLRLPGFLSILADLAGAHILSPDAVPLPLLDFLGLDRPGGVDLSDLALDADRLHQRKRKRLDTASGWRAQNQQLGMGMLEKKLTLNPSSIDQEDITERTGLSRP